MTTTPRIDPRNMTARALLRDASARSAATRAAEEGRAYPTQYVREFRGRYGSYPDMAPASELAARAVWREATGIMRQRLARRERRRIADAAWRPARSRAAEIGEQLDRHRRRAAIAIGVHLAPWIVDAGIAECRYGSGGQEVENWDRYSKRWHRQGPSRYRAAGARVVRKIGERRLPWIVIEDSRGRVVARYPVPPLAWARRMTYEQIAERLVGRISRTRLDSIGPVGEDDRAELVEPYLVGRSRDPEGAPAMIVASRPAQLVHAWVAGRRCRDIGEPVVQVVVLDRSTGQRHAITVPARYGQPIDRRRETIASRIREALAWTWGLDADSYRPSISA